MPNRLLKKCLHCDHCIITFDTKDSLKGSKEPLTKDHPRLKKRVASIFNRDNIKEIRCDIGAIRDHQGMEKKYYSNTALISARSVEGNCPYYSPEEDEDEQ